MPQLLNQEVRENLLARGFSRRHFSRIISMIGAGAALPFYNEAALAQTASGVYGVVPADVVRINGNENPLGPCPEAVEAAIKITPHLNRYQPTNELEQFKTAVTASEGLKPENIAPFAGSSDPLQRITLAFTSPTRSLVMADPGYEASSRAATFIGAKVHRVPLRSDYSHDVKAMLAADPNAGLFYICNPNNPSGTITSKADIEWLLANKPKDAILLLDEAYIHFSTAEMGSPWVAQGKDLIVLRTFSKAYGMAGLRMGMALGRPDLLAKMMPYGAGGFLPMTGLVAATASVKSAALVPARRKANAATRESVFNFLEQKKFSYVPSTTNFFMLEVNRPGKEMADAMIKEKILIGRTWPVWPTKVRITIGSADEMKRFQAALLKLTA
jgi:histidinol-phosphate aminotransferase